MEDYCFGNHQHFPVGECLFPRKIAVFGGISNVAHAASSISYLISEEGELVEDLSVEDAYLPGYMCEGA